MRDEEECGSCPQGTHSPTEKQTCQQAVPTRWQGSWPSRRIGPSTLGTQHKASPALPTGCQQLCLEGRVDLELSGQVHRWMNEGKGNQVERTVCAKTQRPESFAFCSAGIYNICCHGQEGTKGGWERSSAAWYPTKNELGFVPLEIACLSLMQSRWYS